MIKRPPLLLHPIYIDVLFIVFKYNKPRRRLKNGVICVCAHSLFLWMHYLLCKSLIIYSCYFSISQFGIMPGIK